jgi:hypothetical protein
MNIERIAENIRYASTDDINKLVKALGKVSEEQDNDLRVMSFASALRRVVDPPHDCGGPAFGRLTAGCPACDQLGAGRPAKQGYANLRYR